MELASALSSIVRVIGTIDRRHLWMLLFLWVAWALLAWLLSVDMHATFWLSIVAAVLTHPLTLVSGFRAWQIYRWHAQARASIRKPRPHSRALLAIMETDRILRWLSATGKKDSPWRDSVGLSHLMVFLMTSHHASMSEFNASTNAEEEATHHRLVALSLLVRTTARYVFRCSSGLAGLAPGLHQVNDERPSLLGRAVGGIDPPAHREAFARSLVASDGDGPGFLSTASYMYSIACALAAEKALLGTVYDAIDESMRWSPTYGWLMWRAFAFALVAAAVKQPATRIAASLTAMLPGTEHREVEECRFAARQTLIDERANLIAQFCSVAR